MHGPEGSWHAECDRYDGAVLSYDGAVPNFCTQHASESSWHHHFLTHSCRTSGSVAALVFMRGA